MSDLLVKQGGMRLKGGLIRETRCTICSHLTGEITLGAGSYVRGRGGKSAPWAVYWTERVAKWSRRAVCEGLGWCDEMRGWIGGRIHNSTASG